MGRLIRYSSTRFGPRFNDYTYPELRRARPSAGHRMVRSAPAHDSRSGFSRKDREELRR